MSVRYDVVVEKVESRALAGNPLGDPTLRELPLLIPEGHDPAVPTPLVFVLAGFGSLGRMMLAEDPWSETLRQRVERLHENRRVGPMIYALPDCFTRLGGSQYINSSATGNYEDYLWHDLLGAVRARAAVSRIGLVGKSSGGYGALVQAMRHPELVSAVACHSGDLAFEYCYLRDLPKLVRTLRRHGGLEGFLRDFDNADRKRESRWLDALNVIAMAACYSPDATAPRGIAFPCDLETGALDAGVWSRWLSWDPVRMLDQPAHVEALRKLALLFVDCGTRDEFFLDLGARQLAAKLRALGVPHVHEEFDDGHMGTSYRYDTSLPRIWKALRDPADPTPPRA